MHEMDDLGSGLYGKRRARTKMSSQQAKQITEGGGAHRAPAVSRAATVLRLLAGERSGLGVTEIARKVGLVPSTCLHVLRALVDEGFIAFDAEHKTYRTGVGVRTLVRDAMESNEFRKVAQPTLDRLAADYRVTAVAVELDSRDRMV